MNKRLDQTKANNSHLIELDQWEHHSANNDDLEGRKWNQSMIKRKTRTHQHRLHSLLSQWSEEGCLG